MSSYPSGSLPNRLGTRNRAAGNGRAVFLSAATTRFSDSHPPKDSAPSGIPLTALRLSMASVFHPLLWALQESKRFRREVFRRGKQITAYRGIRKPAGCVHARTVMAPVYSKEFVVIKTAIVAVVAVVVVQAFAGASLAGKAQEIVADRKVLIAAAGN